jgi:cytochrome P450
MTGCPEARPTLKFTDTTQLTDVDLADPKTYQDYDPHYLWRLLRTTNPVYKNPATAEHPAFWVITRYADICSVYKDGARFTSEGGNVLTTLLAGGDSASGKMLAVTDGEKHQNLRNIMLKAFSPRRLSHIETRVRQHTLSLVQSGARLDHCDFATEIAERIPINTICDLLGVPDSLNDRDALLKLTKMALSVEASHHTVADSIAARNELLLYFADLVEERRAAPLDDVVSVLSHSEAGGEPLSDDEIILNCYSLIIGGDETSRLAMIGSIPALAEHPAQWQSLRDGKVSVDTATEEILRWTSPAMHFGRTATQDVVICGHRILRGDIVTLWNASANRDEEVFHNPEELDLQRAKNRHIAFGYGSHFCIGAYLGRVEIKALLTALRTCVAEIRITGEPKRLYSNFLSGFSSLPISFVENHS